MKRCVENKVYINVFYCIWMLLAQLLLSDVYAQIDSTENPNTCNTIHFFYQQGCPHCARARIYLDGLQMKHPHISIISHDLSRSRQDLEWFILLNQKNNIQRPGVPSFSLCNRFLVGFDPNVTSSNIEQILRSASYKNALANTEPHYQSEINLPMLGKINYQQMGLPLFTVLIGLVDGFNPCAMWVLLFLLSLLVNLKSRKRILLIAGTFVLVSGMVYYAFMAAWLNLFLIIGFSRTLQITIGAIAILIGTIHIKDYFAFKKGATLSIPESSKPGIYARAREIIQANNLIAALISVFIIAVLVNFLELLCTAGLPALYTQILTLHQLSQFQYYGYLVLYNLAYIFDDALMVGIVVYTLSRHKIQEQHGRWLKLTSGTVVLVLGLLLAFEPQWLF